MIEDMAVFTAAEEAMVKRREGARQGPPEGVFHAAVGPPGNDAQVHRLAIALGIAVDEGEQAE